MVIVHSAPVTRNAMKITREDIELLVREPSAAMRSRIAEKIGKGYGSGDFSESEITLANEIFRLLTKDTEIKVRKLIAMELKDAHNVPHDIIMKLAQDHHEVATPVLQYSTVLSEDDLIAIVLATREHPKLRAIASRRSISKELSHALVATHDARIVSLVVTNKGAQMAETTIEDVLEEFGRDHDIMEELVYRGGLSHGFAEKLFSKVSNDLKKQLTKKYRLGKHVVDDSSGHARETALLQFISPWMSQQDMTGLIEQMHKNGRLTDSVIFRSLAIGDLRFFETAIAQRVGIPASNARILLLDPGPLGFKALYESAHLPAGYYPAVNTMLRLALQETEYGKYRATDFAKRMSEHIHRGGYLQSVEHMDMMLTMIGRAFHDRPTIH